MRFIEKQFYLFLVCIALLAIGARMYHLNYPIADWHSWRQVDTAAVARNFLKWGIKPLYPHTMICLISHPVSITQRADAWWNFRIYQVGRGVCKTNIRAFYY